LYYSLYFGNLIFRSLLLSCILRFLAHRSIYYLLQIKIIQFAINKKLCELEEECIRDVHMRCQLSNLLDKRLVHRVSACFFL